MYKRILVPVENSAADKWILQHVAGLAKLCGAQVLLLHVADGWAARNMEQLNLRESQEMKEDRAYLERISDELRRAGVEVDAVLAAGDPAREIAAAADREKGFPCHRSLVVPEIRVLERAPVSGRTIKHPVDNSSPPRGQGGCCILWSRLDRAPQNHGSHGWHG